MTQRSKLTIERVETVTKVRKKRMKSPDQHVLFIRGLNPDLHAQFKSYCAKRGKTMKKLIVGFMQRMVDKARMGEKGDE